MRPFAPEPDLSERIHDAVLNAICSGELRSGARITQEELAQQFGVSRQPVLQAMMLLRREGFLIDAGRKGVCVAPLDVEQANNLYYVRAALDGAVNRIVAIGWGSTRMEPVVVLCKDEDQEARALEQFWALAQTGSGTRRLIQFNGVQFDLPIMLTRSSLLGLKAPVLNLSKYEKNPNTDLMLLLSHYGAMPTHGLQFWCSRYGIADLIPHPAPAIAAISGADIPRLVAEHTDAAWSLIQGHCEHDIRQTVALAKRLGVI